MDRVLCGPAKISPLFNLPPEQTGRRIIPSKEITGSRGVRDGLGPRAQFGTWAGRARVKEKDLVTLIGLYV